MKSRLLLLALFASPALISLASDAPKLTPPQIDAKAREVLAQMTVEEKALQLFSYKPNGVPRLGVPHLEAGEVLHGVVSKGATVFPQSIALGATWDPDLIHQVATVIAKEARAVGLHQGFAPMLGLARDSRWGRVEESYGEDPFLVSRIAVAYITGLQGTGAEFLDHNHIVATPKHFVADGEPLAGANGEDYDVSDRVLREIYLPPFEAAVKEAHTRSIMPGHHGLNGVPCHANHWLLQSVLRDEWGFDGFVTSDMGDIPKLSGGHKYVPTSGEAAVAALQAGVDMELVGDIYKTLPKSIQDGKLSEATLNQSALRVLKTKIELLGLSEPSASPAASADAATDQTKQTITTYKGEGDIWAKLVAEGKFNTPENSRRADWQTVLNDPAHDALALQSAREAIVLLKNQNNLLPLDKTKLKRVLVVGPLAKGMNLGGYSSAASKVHVDILDGLKAALPGVEVNFVPGCSLKDSTESELPKAVAAAANADVIIAVLGQSRAQVGENVDRDHLDLIGGQQKLAEAMQATGKPLVVVLNHGAPLAINGIAEKVPAILDCLYLGQATGQAVAEVLFGDYNPGGKLPFTVPRNVGQVPCYYNHTPYHGPINYYQSQGGPLYPFGFGLSYTTFEYADCKVTPAQIQPNQTATVSVTVRNSGSRPGDEVVQFYLRQDYTSLKRPEKELKGFKRITLQPGEKKTVEFPVGFEQVKFWKDGKWVSEPGQVQLLIGSSCADLRAKTKLTVSGL